MFDAYIRRRLVGLVPGVGKDTCILEAIFLLVLYPVLGWVFFLAHFGLKRLLLTHSYLADEISLLKSVVLRNGTVSVRVTLLQGVKFRSSINRLVIVNLSLRLRAKKSNCAPAAPGPVVQPACPSQRIGAGPQREDSAFRTERKAENPEHFQLLPLPLRKFYRRGLAPTCRSIEGSRASP